MFAFFLDIIFKSIKLDKSLYTNSKYFGEAGIYFAGLIMILDGVAGLWCVNAGHCRSKIVEAVKKQVENTKNTPTESNKSKDRPYTGHPMIMSFPSAKGMEQITGDSLLIKCFKYIPPAISVDYKLETRELIN